MQYASADQVNDHIKTLLHRVAPGFTLMHWRGEITHTNIQATVCATDGMNRLMFTAHVYPTAAYAGRFNWIGIGIDCHHEIGLDRRVQMLMRVHPDAHIQFIDNEGEGDNFLFGYVAYDESFRAIAWAPLPVDDEGDAHPDDLAKITHTLPAELHAEMEYVSERAVAQRR